MSGPRAGIRDGSAPAATRTPSPVPRAGSRATSVRRPAAWNARWIARAPSHPNHRHRAEAVRVAAIVIRFSATPVRNPIAISADLRREPSATSRGMPAASAIAARLARPAEVAAGGRLRVRHDRPRDRVPAARRAPHAVRPAERHAEPHAVSPAERHAEPRVVSPAVAVRWARSPEVASGRAVRLVLGVPRACPGAVRQPSIECEQISAVYCGITIWTIDWAP